MRNGESTGYVGSRLLSIAIGIPVSVDIAVRNFNRLILFNVATHSAVFCVLL